MRLNSLLLPCAMLRAGINACALERRQSEAQSPFVIGIDGPAEQATLGWTINDVCLISNNLTATEEFYGQVLGMRHLFRYTVSDKYTIMYMGHSNGGKNETGYQTGEEMYVQKNNREGLIEWVYVNETGSSVPPTGVQANTFSHIGLIVPDVNATAERMSQYGAKILKASGEAPALDGNSSIARAWGVDKLDEADRAAVLEGIAGIGFDSFLIVEDPDGNILEVQQQYLAGVACFA